MVFDGRKEVELGKLGSIPGVYGTQNDEILVMRIGGELVGVSNVCTHKMGPLNEGGLIGNGKQVVECPWHGFQFNLRTGLCLKGGARRLRRYQVHAEGNVLYAQEVAP